MRFRIRRSDVLLFVRMRLRWSDVVLLLALPAFAGALAPFAARLHWSFDLAACFPVHALGALLLAGAALCAAKRFRAAAVCAAGAALAAVHVVPPMLAARTAVVPDGAPLRVLALNLLRENEDAARALAAVRAHAPDVLFCSEVTPAWQRALAPLHADYPHRCERADPGWFGLALFSRWPLRDAAIVPLGFDWAPAVRAVVATPAGDVGVLGVHTPRPGRRKRTAERDRALAALADALQPLPEPRIVLGDCNATPWTPAFRDALAATGLVDACGRGFRPTWPARLPWPLRVPIDHVLVSPGSIGVGEIAVGPAFGSDHLPLAVTLRVPRAQEPASAGGK